MSRNPNIIEQLVNLYLLAVIVVASILAFMVNYWLGLGILFVGLLMLIVFRFRTSEYLELLLTMYSLIPVSIVIGSLVQGWLMSEGRRSPIAPLNGLVAALPDSYPATIFISLLVGISAALFLAGIPFLLLGLNFVSVTIKDGEIKGKEGCKQKPETFGGLRQVRIYPGQVVVFHKHGKITRAAGLGTTLFRRGEKIKAIIPLGMKVGIQKIEYVLTRDRIALTLSVAHGAGIELVSGTNKRLEEIQDKVARAESALNPLKAKVWQAVQREELAEIRQHLAELEAQEASDQETIDLLKEYQGAVEQLQKDKGTIEQLQRIVESQETVGDEHDRCYVDIAKLVATKVPDPPAATKGSVEANLRDVFMVNGFEDLFEIEGEAEDLKTKVDQRKIAEIEQFVLDKVKKDKLSDGIMLNFVDISEINFAETLRTRSLDSLRKKYFNPYMVGKPVTGDNFIGRQDILTDLIMAVQGNNHLIIEGERRIGKTSVLYKLAEVLRQDRDHYFIPAYIQLQRVTEEKLFYAILREIARASRRRYEQLPLLQCEAPYVNYDTFSAEDDLSIIIKTLKEITDLPLRVVILLDEGDRLRDFTEETHSQLRGWMGADLQKDVLILVWCGVSFDKAWHLRTSPWYNQFRGAIEVSPLETQEAKLLITRPVEDHYHYEDEAIERILTLSQQKPFIIQLICHECIRWIWQKQLGAIITLADVETVWPLVQERLASDELAETSSLDDVSPSLTYQISTPSQQLAEKGTAYEITPEEPADDS